MPELPEVEIVKQSLSKKIKHKRVKKIIIKNRNLRFKLDHKFSNIVQNSIVENIYRFSKYLIIKLDNSYYWLIHLGMSGTLHVVDKNKQKFQLQKTIINIFNGEEIKYIIKSDESTLSNNNKFLELKGNVKLKTIGQDEDILHADNFIWNIDETNYLLRGNIRFENKNIILNSAKAKLGSDKIIEFFNPVKYVIKGNNNEDKYEIKSENAYYNIETESVSFKAKDKRVQSIIYF